MSILVVLYDAARILGANRGVGLVLRDRYFERLAQVGDGRKVRDEQAQRDAQTIRFKDAKLEKLTFELARLRT